MSDEIESKQVVEKMSSNYLNYELSKELKELGVEFLQEDSSRTVLYTDEKGIKQWLYRPGTAQLIDAVNKINPGITWDYFFKQDPCCTTAAGMALVKLTKDGEE